VCEITDNLKHLLNHRLVVLGPDIIRRSSLRRV